MKISIVTPLYRSAPYIEALYRRCVDAIHSIDAADYEIVFVNDGSPTDDAAIAKAIAAQDHNVTVVDLARNYGQHRAIMVGLQHARGDLVFVLDADLEDEPEWLPRFHKEMLRTGGDVVYGVQTRRKRGIVYRGARNVFNWLMRHLSGATFRENAVKARLMTRRYVDAVLQFKEREIFIDGIWEMCGFSQVPIDVAKYDRSPTTYTPHRLISLAINGITSFSTRPLIAIALIGFSVCALAFAYTAIIVARKFLFGLEIEGWSSIMAAVLIVGGVSILSNGIIAVYLAKIFLEVKQRPPAIIKEVYPPRHAAQSARVDMHNHP